MLAANHVTVDIPNGLKTNELHPPQTPYEAWRWTRLPGPRAYPSKVHIDKSVHLGHPWTPQAQLQERYNLPTEQHGH